MSHRSSTHASTHTPTVPSASTFRATSPTGSPSLSEPRAGSAFRGTDSRSPVARNAVVHPIEAAPPAAGFILDYQI